MLEALLLLLLLLPLPLPPRRGFDMFTFGGIAEKGAEGGEGRGMAGTLFCWMQSAECRWVRGLDSSRSFGCSARDHMPRIQAGQVD